MKIKLVVHIKRWHDKKNGNYYYSAQMWDTMNGNSFKIPFGYCSCESYLQDIRLKLEYLRWNPNDLQRDRSLVLISEVSTMKECKAYGE